ncbi:hypothetical protein FRX31_023628 [Thalictrum thalictroides]|uniref:Uncharacterized protein n=1 Tax=Thalictrum thalictroides TaxID=46969 RepID=A0A7J6VPS8_THATH|nr:hypothetical protein FRX31_023628 [Thalictrum thalictroides]
MAVGIHQLSSTLSFHSIFSLIPLSQGGYLAATKKKPTYLSLVCLLVVILTRCPTALLRLFSGDEEETYLSLSSLLAGGHLDPVPYCIAV